MKRGKLLIASLTIWLSVLPSGAEAQWVQVDSGLAYSTLTYVRSFCAIGTSVFAGTDPGGVFRSTDNGTSWTAASGGRTNFYVKSLAAIGTNLFAGTQGNVLRSTDNGATWISTGLNRPDIYALAVSGANLFAGTDDGVFLSTDNGTTWTAENNGLTYLAVNALAVKGTNLFAATDDGEVFRSTNNGTIWKPVNAGLSGSIVWSLVVSGTNLFAGADLGGVFLSTDNGTTWSEVDSGIPGSRVTSLVVSGSSLFAGTTSGGVFLSTDSGTNWKAVNLGLTNTAVMSLAVVGTNLFAGTANGGGILRRPLSDTLLYGKIPEDLLVAYYPFSGNAIDVSGGGNHGTVNGATLAADRFGTPQSAYHFDGVTQYIRVPNSSGLQSVAYKTVSFWINMEPGGGPQNPRIISKGYPGGFEIGTVGTDVSRNILFVQPGVNFVSKGTVSGGLWHHCVWTYNGSVSSVYIDNMRDTTGAFIPSAVSTDMYIGRASTLNTADNFKGSIDDIRIYNRALSSSEISALYTEGGWSGNPDPGPVANYPFNGNANDVSGKGKDGIVFGATLASDRFGNAQSAYHFDGVTQYIRVPNSSGLQSVVYKTVSFWINMEPGGGPQNPRIISKGYTGGFEIGTAGTDVSRNIIFVQPGVNFVSNGKVSSGSWHHCVWTYGGSVSSLYIDNAKDITGAFTPSPVTTDMYIGRNSVLSSADNFKGFIDDIRIYNRVLSSSEISALYTEGGWTGSPDLGPVAYYPFNGNANDASGKGNNGVVNGATLTADRFGNAQSAYHFDGVTQYIRVPNSSGIQSVAYKTISFWVNMETGGAPWNPRIISKGRYGGFEIGTSGTDVSRNILFMQPDVNFVSNGKVSSGTWHQCVWTYNGTVSSVYIDNVKDIVGEFTPLEVSTDMYIGRTSALSAYDNFKGSIDDIRIYNRTLSGGEIDSLYHEGGWDSGALPVQLASFSATRVRDDSIRFAWTTISEINNYGFFVQHRYPGDQTFSDMAGSFVPGHGSTIQQHDYLFATSEEGRGEREYRLRQVDLEGAIHYSETIRVDGRALQGANIPLSPELAQNYPNPFNPSTTIRYGLSQRSNVRLELYNTLGQKVAGLVSEDQDAGYHEVKFDGSNMASGLYFYRITAGNFVETKKLLLVR